MVEPVEPQEALATILSALQAVMMDVGYIQKTGLNTYSKTSYATQEDILAALRPAMLSHGLFLVGPRTDGPVQVIGENSYVTYEWDLAHISGAVWPDPISVVGCGRNTKGFEDRGVYKAATGAQRYALMKLFQIATGDDPEAIDPADYEAVPGKAVSRAAEAGIAHAAQPDTPAGKPEVVEKHLAASADAKRSKRERIQEAAQAAGIALGDVTAILERLKWPTMPSKLEEDQVVELCMKHIPEAGKAAPVATEV